MCDQVVTREIIPFLSIPFDDLFLSWVVKYVHNHRFLTCSPVELIIDRDVHAMNTLALKFWLKFTIFRISRQNT